MKTQDLIGPALDWAVMKAEGPDSFAANVYYDGDTPVCVDDQIDLPEMWRPSTDWSQGGPIIERERISAMETDAGSGEWEAFIWLNPDMHMPLIQEGPTPLIAAMRAYVASVLGDTVEIPEAIAC